MRTPFAVVAALIGSSLLETQGKQLDSSDYSMSLAQVGTGSGIAEVSVRSKKDEFVDEEEDDEDDGTGYGHYSSKKNSESKHEKADSKIEHKHHGKHALQAQPKTHKHQHLAPAEAKKPKAAKEAEKKEKAAAAEKKKADAKLPNPPPVKGMPPIKNIDKLEGRMIVIRGTNGPKYSFGQAHPIKSDKQQVTVVAKPFNPKDQTQRFIWDSRTKSLRLFHRKDFALSLYKGDEKDKFQTATLRKWINGPVQKNFMYNGHWILPWKGNAKLCLEFTKFHPGSPLTWLPCRKTEMQGFSIQLISFKTIRNNREKRVVLPAAYDINQADGHMLLLRGTHGPKYTLGYEKRIRKLSDERPVVTRAFNTQDNNQRWTYDSRTKSLRLFHQRGFALSFTLKTRRYGSPASVRLFKNELTQKHSWKEGKVHTEVNKWTKFCLGHTSVAPNSPVTWQACRKTLNQNFKIMAVTIQSKMRDTTEPRVETIITGTSEKDQKQKAAPIKKPAYGKKFYLELNMKGKRRLFMSAQKDGEDNVAKIAKGINDWRAWFIMDRRTKSIRLDAHRSLALSNKDSLSRLGVGKNIAFRKFAKTADQTDLEFKDSGKKEIFKLINKAKKCLTVHNYLNKDESLLMYWHCNKNPTQSWKKFEAVPAKKQKGKLWTTPFFIKSGLKGARNLYQSKQKKGDDVVLKISADIEDWRALFIQDKRTGSIRLYSDRSVAISNTAAKTKKDRLKTGREAVLRKFKGQVDQVNLIFANKKLVNKGRKCLTVKHYKDKDETSTTWWKCNKNPAQVWAHPFFTNKQKKSFKGLQTLSGPSAPRLDLNLDSIDQQMIIVRGTVAPSFAISYAGKIVPLKKNMPELQVVSKPYNMQDKSQQLIWEKRTKTLRPFHFRQYALSFDNKLGYFPGKYGSRAIFRPFKKESTQTIGYTGQISTKFGLNKFCLNPVNLQPGSQYEWDACQRVNTQMFSLNSITFLRRTKTGHKKIKHVKTFDTSTADGQVVLFRGSHGPRYTIGVVGRIRKQSDEPFIRTRVLNHQDVFQHFTWDTRTKSIRLFAKRDFALSVRLTGNYVIAKIYKNEPSQALRYDGRLHTKFRGTELHLTFENFRPLAPIKWEPFTKAQTQQLQVIIIQERQFKRQNDRPRVQQTIDSKGDHKFPEHVHKDKKIAPKFSKRFMLENTGKGKLRLYVSKQVNGKDRILKVTKKRNDWRAWFIYDARTKSIRLDAHRYLALSNQDGSNRLNVGKTAGMRKWGATVDQKNIHLKAASKKNVILITNYKKKCLTPNHFKLKDMNTLTWWHCNQNPSQAWTQIKKIPLKHPKGKLWESPFHIQSKMPGNRSVFMTKQKNGKDQIVKISKDVDDWRSLFIVDKRSRTIRLHSNRKLALSNQDSLDTGKKRMKKGKMVAMREFKKGQLDQEIWLNHGHFVNGNKQCLTMTNYRNKDENTLMFWQCNKNPTQNWEAKIYAIKHEDPSLAAPELRKLSMKPMSVTAEKKGKKVAPVAEKKPVIQNAKKAKKVLHGKKVVNAEKPIGKASATPPPSNLNHPLAIKESRVQIRQLQRQKEDASISKMISDIHAEHAKAAREASLAQKTASQSLVQANSTKATQMKQQQASKENVKETINKAGTH